MLLDRHDVRPIVPSLVSIKSHEIVSYVQVVSFSIFLKDGKSKIYFLIWILAGQNNASHLSARPSSISNFPTSDAAVAVATMTTAARPRWAHPRCHAAAAPSTSQLIARDGEHFGHGVVHAVARNGARLGKRNSNSYTPQLIAKYATTNNSGMASYVSATLRMRLLPRRRSSSHKERDDEHFGHGVAHAVGSAFSFS